MQNRIVGFLIKSQQYYLKQLGYYNGKIDGIWCKECSEAMELFKLDDSFKPANSKRNNGPFVPFDRLPEGFTWEIFDGQRGVLKKDNLPYQLRVQQLVNGIVNDTDEKENNRKSNRDALEVLGKKPSKNSVTEDSDSISDYLGKELNSNI